MTSPSTPLYTIDRFEGDVAVLEASDGVTTKVSRSALPPGAREGDVLQTVSWNGCGKRFAPARDATDEARGHAREEIARLGKRDPGGDLTL